MRDVSLPLMDGHLMDTFSIPVISPAPTEQQKIVGDYQLATVTISYTLESINNAVCTSSLITSKTEGKLI